MVSKELNPKNWETFLANAGGGYAAWLSQKTGHRYRLLSEEEYDYLYLFARPVKPIA
jgi:hypothetical protein